MNRREKFVNVHSHLYLQPLDIEKVLKIMQEYAVDADIDVKKGFVQAHLNSDSLTIDEWISVLQKLEASCTLLSEDRAKNILSEFGSDSYDDTTDSGKKNTCIRGKLKIEVSNLERVFKIIQKYNEKYSIISKIRISAKRKSIQVYLDLASFTFEELISILQELEPFSIPLKGEPCNILDKGKGLVHVDAELELRVSDVRKIFEITQNYGIIVNILGIHIGNSGTYGNKRPIGGVVNILAKTVTIRELIPLFQRVKSLCMSEHPNTVYPELPIPSDNPFKNYVDDYSDVMEILKELEDDEDRNDSDNNS